MTSYIVIVIVLILIFVYLYNLLINKKNQVDNIFASIDVLLKKRYDLLPNLIGMLNRYMQDEKELLEKITQLKTKALNPNILNDEKIRLDSQIISALDSILTSIEDYPELKTNVNILHLQQSLNELEKEILTTKKAYNQAVINYNNLVEIIPTNFIARSMNYTRKEVFSIDEKFN